MPRYRGLYGDPDGREAVGTMDSYRAVLDAARATAQRSQLPIIIVDVDSGERQSTVRPDGKVRQA